VSADAVLIESFLGPEDMKTLLSSTVLNFHPPTYDAYGMTVVEAAGIVLGVAFVRVPQVALVSQQQNSVVLVL
jgi:Asp-tRNA(Asn)/Glu-tRNA(Gln) amidotransferase A subunit family amidase